MKWRHLFIVVFWVAVMALLTRAWMSRYVTKTSAFPAPVVATPAPRINKPEIHVLNYQMTEIDRYRFQVSYSVVNNGTRAARSIKVRIEPWLHGTIPGTVDQPLDPTLSIVHEGKEDLIAQVGPGEKVDRVLYFDGVDYARPSLHLEEESFQINFNAE